MKIASMFSGCGGLDLGFVGNFEHNGILFKKTGNTLVYSNDFDPAAVETHRANQKWFGRCEISSADIRSTDAAAIPVFDVLLAGFPCQPFSNAGRREGVLDKQQRGTLFYECERIIRACLEKTNGQSPKAFVFENVKGLLSSKMPCGKLVTEEIRERMEALGFTVTQKLIKTSDYGVPQNRQRLVIIGVQKPYGEFSFERLHAVTKRHRLPTIANDSVKLTLGYLLLGADKVADGTNVSWALSPSALEMVNNIGPCASPDSANLSDFEKVSFRAELNDKYLKGRSWKNVPYKKLKKRFRQIADNPQKYRAPNFYRRFALGEIAGTLTASAQPETCGIVHPIEPRRFTVREAARIQSFPDDFRFPSKNIADAYKVIGNAVPPVMGWVIAMALRSHFRAIR